VPALSERFWGPDGQRSRGGVQWWPCSCSRGRLLLPASGDQKFSIEWLVIIDKQEKRDYQFVDPSQTFTTILPHACLLSMISYPHMTSQRTISHYFWYSCLWRLFQIPARVNQHPQFPFRSQAWESFHACQICKARLCQIRSVYTSKLAWPKLVAQDIANSGQYANEVVFGGSWTDSDERNSLLRIAWTVKEELLDSATIQDNVEGVCSKLFCQVFMDWSMFLAVNGL